MPNIDNSDSGNQEQKTPKSIIKATLEEFQFRALSKESGGFNFDKLTKEQKDEVISLLKLNENNAYKFHNKRLDVLQNLTIKG